MNTLVAEKIKLKARVKRYLADTLTPVSLFLKVRDHYTDPVLLESNDFRSKEDCFSFLGLDSLASFQVQNGTIHLNFPDERTTKRQVENVETVPREFKAFLSQFKSSNRL